MCKELNRAMPSENKAHVLLITGAPGIGKTTVIRRVAQGLKPNRLQGFYTEESAKMASDAGFHLVGFDRTTSHVITHVDFPKSCRVGKYGVDAHAVGDAARLLRANSGTRVTTR